MVVQSICASSAGHQRSVSCQSEHLVVCIQGVHHRSPSSMQVQSVSAWYSPIWISAFRNNTNYKLMIFLYLSFRFAIVLNRRICHILCSTRRYDEHGVSVAISFPAVRPPFVSDWLRLANPYYMKGGHSSVGWENVSQSQCHESGVGYWQARICLTALQGGHMVAGSLLHRLCQLSLCHVALQGCHVAAQISTSSIVAVTDGGAQCQSSLCHMSVAWKSVAF